MRKLLYLFCFGIGFFCTSIEAQNKDQSANKRQIFSENERTNLQVWYDDQVKRMNFSETETEEYYSVIFSYIAKISRLDDADKDYSDEEFNAELDKLLMSQDAVLKEMLTPEQYVIHCEIYNEFIEIAKRRWVKK